MSKRVPLIYVVEDSVPSARLYQSYLETLGYDVRLFHTGQDALAAINDKLPDVLVQDVYLPDLNGLDILREVTRVGLPVSTIVITSETEINHGVEATRHGAFDFIQKPFTKDRLLVTVANALKQAELIDRVQEYSATVDVKGFADFIGSSRAMQLVYRIIENVARSRANVFITGESGTGKELCASAVHKTSPRADGPFVAINCAAIPHDLFESEIFGHVKGAFSGATSDRQGAAELADGGTLFLDEICEMDLNLQAKLLRLIQTNSFQKVGGSKLQSADVRFVCATNRDPLHEVAEGRFREDLYYRLNVVPIELPPLRQRDADMLEIAQSLLLKFGTQLGKGFKGLSPAVQALFLEYDWPGNVRELQNVIENTVILNRGSEVVPAMLPEAFTRSMAGAQERMRRRAAPDAAEPPGAAFDSGLKQAALDDAQGQEPIGDLDAIEPLWLTEKQAIQRAIRICHDNIPLAAARLGVSASTLYRKIKGWEQDA
jgi:two-component system repressor protein LuxO